ncbi:serine/threonine-protein kinase M1 [Ascosphaera aggregata]|nr:serine/threonine-protein kinase M1 [Ascosphaera aggregata]
MVRLAPNHVNAALLQICACLRSALNILDLCDHALISWDIMVRSLEQEELESLLDQTYCIIIKYWDLFQEEESRNRGRQLLEWLRSDRKTVVQSVFESLPALDSIPELQGPEVPAASRLESSDERRITNFIRRLSNEHAIVVEQALKELLQYLSQTRYWNDSTSVDQRATDIKVQLTRCLLNCCAKFNEGGYSIPNLAAQCLGTLGAVDPNQSEFVRPKKDIVVLSNFDDFAETCNFILFFIQNVLVRAYLSSDAESQGFLAWAMQHFLSLCGFQNAGFVPTSQASSMNNYYQRWFSLPKFVRNLLTPLLSSNYTIEPAIRTNCTHPIFSIHTSHSTWLRVFVLDMLHKAPKDGNKYSNVFEISSKIIKKRDIVIASFLLPYAALNIFLNGNDDLKNDVISEMLNVLRYPLPDNNNEHRKNAILCSESVFSIMDYCSRWAQARRKGMANLLMRPTGGSEDVYKKRAQQLSSLEATLSQIPAEVLSTRAVECQSFTRALLHWEKHIRRQMEPDSNGKIADLMPLYTRLQEIYAHIDEPDGAEGITADPHLFKIDQQVIESRRGTRWLAAQNWFSSQIAKDPEDCKAQIGLLSCLKDRGQHGVLLSQFDTLRSSEKTLTSTLPMVIDSAWMAGDLTRLSRYLEIASEKHIDDFAIGIGSVLQSLYCGETETATQQIESLRRSVAKGLTVNAVSSLKRSHESVLKLHALSELEQVAIAEKSSTFDDLNQRLTMLGGCIHDKCYVLNLRRVAMEILSFDASSVASVWLQLARSARKANNIEEAFNAVTRAVKLGEPQAALEFAKLLWREGSPRKAIQMLEETINSNALASAGYTSPVDSARVDRPHNPSLISAKAHLLLARWMDNAGQTQSEIIARKYRYAISLHPRWEKAHYHLGKHYAKILESEKSKPSDKQSHIFLSGEASKLVVDNFLRSLAYGNKYVFQSLPKILTLWFESAAALDEPYDERSGWSKDFHKHIMAQRLKSLRFINEQVRKYTDRIPTVLFLTILPQLVARICHPNKDLNAVLRRIIMKTTFTYVQQALWTILPLLKSLSVDRRKKGKLIFSEIQEAGRRAELSDRSLDITRVLREGQKLSDALVGLCSKEAKNRVSEKRTKASLTRDLLFDRSIARCSLVVPFETNMIPLLPLAHDAAYFAKFRPFPQGPVTFDDISDEVLILRSAQKPRKLNVRGSDGRMYGLLCKPEDLRKDERLMEFNRMINRFLKKDADSSSRQLYIKTYAVTPLNETSGLIEWVNNFRTLKDLIVRLLGDRGITLDWGQIQRDLSDTSSEKSKIEAFTSKVLRRYPPVFHEWFLEAFPEPGSWFAARLRYTRTCAVMSMVGHCLGLGDRHGENILFEEANGAVLHVDFNCLFDMGLTLQVPERVPFRLTHNMVDALGVCGYNGPFRRTSEITLSILRQSEDWLVPILETFVHDPTTEFLLAKQRTSVKVPSTAQEMLESVQNKLRGLLPGESVPLSVGGQVDELIMQATSTKNLAHMYVGWAPWL